MKTYLQLLQTSLFLMVIVMACDDDETAPYNQFDITYQSNFSPSVDEWKE